MGVSLPHVSEQALLLGGTGLLLLWIGVSLPPYPILAQFRTESLRGLPDVLAPLVVLALFLERAVEVVMVAWRSGEARRLGSDLDKAMAEGTIQQQWQARRRIDAYTAQTQRLAFFVAFLGALLISMMGVRAIEMLISDGLIQGIPDAQRTLFVRVDILVTALLLTGGAEGIHRVVTAFTTFLSRTKDRLEHESTSAVSGTAPAVAGTPPPTP